MKKVISLMLALVLALSLTACGGKASGPEGVVGQFCKGLQELDEKAIAKRPDNRAMENAILAGDLGGIAENLCNVFDPVVTAEHLELNYIKSIMNTYGAVGSQMTGSGSAVFGIFESFEFAAVACNMLKDNYPQIFIGKNA